METANYKIYSPDATDTALAQTQMARMAQSVDSALVGMDVHWGDLDEKLDGALSAYDVAVNAGYAGTLDDWLASLKGDRGPTGPYGGTEVTDPQVASYVNDLSTQTRTALDAQWLRRNSTRDASGSGDFVTIQDDSSSGTNSATVRMTDTSAHTGPILNVYHKGNGGTQSYGINVANMPDAKGAITVHQYSARTPALQIDNTDKNTAIYIKNTENQTMNPGGSGTGNFMQFLPYGETGGLSLTNSLTWLNNSSKDLKIQATSPSIYAFGVQVDADKTGLQVIKSATGGGNAAWIDNAGTGNALFVSQRGAGEAARFDNAVEGKVSTRVTGKTHALVVSSSVDGGVTSDVVKSATGGGIAQRIMNKGTGASLSVQNDGGEVAKIQANGEIELLTPGAGVVMRSANGTRYKMFINDSGQVSASAV